MFVHTPLLRPSEQKKSHGTVCSPSVPERYWRMVSCAVTGAMLASKPPKQSRVASKICLPGVK